MLRRLTVSALALVTSMASYATTIVFNPQAKQPVVMHAKDVLLVKLDTVSDAGYSWTYVKTTKGVVKLQSQTIQPVNMPSPGQPVVAGGASVTLFRFEGLKKGDDQISLTYGRSWELEKGAKATRTMKIKVSVR